MDITYKSSWDAIQEALVKHAGNQVDYDLVKAAYEIKTAVESIEQQKRLEKLQKALSEQQRSLVSATKRLMVFTGVLVIVGAITGYFSWLTLEVSQVQTDAANRSALASLAQVVATKKMASISDQQVNALVNLRKSIQMASKPVIDFTIDRSSDPNKLYIENKGPGIALNIVIIPMKSRGIRQISSKRMHVLKKGEHKFISFLKYDQHMQAFLKLQVSVHDINRVFYKWHFKVTSTESTVEKYVEFEFTPDGKKKIRKPIWDPAIE